MKGGESQTRIAQRERGIAATSKDELIVDEGAETKVNGMVVDDASGKRRNGMG